MSIVELAACIGALACAFAPWPTAIIEQRYSVGFYPELQRSLTPLSNRLPFAILDVLLVGLTVATIVTLTQAIREAWQTPRRREPFARWRTSRPSARFFNLSFCCCGASTIAVYRCRRGSSSIARRPRLSMSFSSD